MIITFHGVRGSIPAPGPNTAKYGGNTSCVHLKMNNGENIIFDAGTGLRTLGVDLMKDDGPINLLLSHGHWDHIQGYPFFVPIYIPDRQVDIFTLAPDGNELLESIANQMSGINFPIHDGDLQSRRVYHYEDTESHFEQRGIRIIKKALNHPGSGSAYRVEEDGVSCAYVTDNELEPPYEVHTTYDEWVDYLHGVDVMIHDAQYTEADMPHKHGWGHSLISQVRQLALDAEVGTLVMFHHDPDRTDGEIDEIQLENEAHFKGKHAPAQSVCAAEGMRIKLTKQVAGGDTRVEIE